MIWNGTDHAQDRLALRSRLSDIAQAPAWTQELALRYAIPGDVQFAMDLCLEEVLSNIIRHGYAGAEDRPIIVNFTMPCGGYFVIEVDDEAPYFNPLNAPELPVLSPIQQIEVGGQGIRLLRRFADALEYEATPTGNRLRIGFSATGSEVQTK
jgi:serine/threonine-protein kinase RsbW